MSKVSRGRSRLLSWLVLVIGLSVIISSLALQWWPADTGRADPADASQVALGKVVYMDNCASCHGGQLQGQPDWQKRLPNGRMPAPPHNQNGHTWHHPDRMLFGIIRDGMVPPWAPPDYESDMPGFGGQLGDDEIWAVLAYIKSRWPQKIRDWQAEKSRQLR